MVRIATFVAAFLAVAFLSLTPSQAAQRVALVIGNSAYKHASPLPNPKNDAEAIAEQLIELGFDVTVGMDLKQRDFAKLLTTFKNKLEHAGVALFFYAGHGLQVSGRNYLVPIDAVLDDEMGLTFETVELGAILDLMERRKRTNLVFLDACRDNPLARNLVRSMGTRSTAVGQGLARVESGVGTMIAFATQPGNVALDGEQQHSPFAQGLIKHIATPGLDVSLMMRKVRQDVIDLTGGAQVPWEHSSLTSSFIFKDLPKDKVNVASANPQAGAFSEDGTGTPSIAGVGRNTDSVAVELAFWEATKDAGNRQAYEAYMKKFPEGNFTPLAVIKLDELKQADEKTAQQQAELEAAKKKAAEAEQAKAMAEAKQKITPGSANKKQAAAEAAKRKAEAEAREREVAELERKQAAERAQLAKERSELAQRLKDLEELVKKRAEAEEAQKMAALNSENRQIGIGTNANLAAAPQMGVIQNPILDPRQLARELQQELKNLGCYTAGVDGDWGQGSQFSMTRFNALSGMRLPTHEPTNQTLAAVRSWRGGQCKNLTKTKAVSRPAPKKYNTVKQKRSTTTSQKKSQPTTTQKQPSGGGLTGGIILGGGGIGLKF